MRPNLNKILILLVALTPLIPIYSHIIHGEIQFFTASHEPLAYRFLVSSRIVNGDNLVWFPQGHLTTLFHNIIMLLSGWNKITISELRNATQGFGFYHHLTGCIILISSMLILFKKLNYSDLVSTYLLGISLPLIACGTFATHYFVSTDYLTLNIILMVISLGIFHYGMNIHTNQIKRKHHILAAIFVGLVVSTK